MFNTTSSLLTNAEATKRTVKGDSLRNERPLIELGIAAFGLHEVGAVVILLWAAVSLL